MYHNCNVLSIVPYRVLPATTGGHAGVVQLHNAVGKLCPDHIAGTTDNGKNETYSFFMHPVFSTKPARYIPFNNLKELTALAKTVSATHIFCDHPYMMPSAITLSKRLKIPLYMRSHNIESERFRTLGKKWWPVMFWFERYAMKHANGVFFITPEEARWAEKHYRLSPARCHIIPFGTNKSEAPSGHQAAKTQLAAELNIPAGKPWLYFIGILDYAPNIQAVEFILDEIMPRLDRSGTDYQVLVAGKGLPETILQKIEKTGKIQYLGFVNDLDLFLKAADIMLNPVILGGGMKTKAIEALSYNKIVVSAHSGAAGLNINACGDNLLIAPDYDWDDYTKKTAEAMRSVPDIPKAFFDIYNWGNIAEKILTIMEQTSRCFL